MNMTKRFYLLFLFSIFCLSSNAQYYDYGIDVNAIYQQAQEYARQEVEAENALGKSIAAQATAMAKKQQEEETRMTYDTTYNTSDNNELDNFHTELTLSETGGVVLYVSFVQNYFRQVITRGNPEYNPCVIYSYGFRSCRIGVECKHRNQTPTTYYFTMDEIPHDLASKWTRDFVVGESGIDWTFREGDQIRILDNGVCRKTVLIHPDFRTVAKANYQQTLQKIQIMTQGQQCNSGSAVRNSRNYGTESSGVSHHWVPCSYCNGTGYVNTDNVPTFGDSDQKWCEQCHSYVSASHCHGCKVCPSCGGKGGRYR